MLWARRTQFWQHCQNVLPNYWKISTWTPKQMKKLKIFEKKSSNCSPHTMKAVLKSLQNFRRRNRKPFFQLKGRKWWKNEPLEKKVLSSDYSSWHVERRIDNIVEQFSLTVWKFFAQSQKMIWKNIKVSKNIFPAKNPSNQEKGRFVNNPETFSPNVTKFFVEGPKMTKTLYILKNIYFPQNLFVDRWNANSSTLLSKRRE